MDHQAIQNKREDTKDAKDTKLVCVSARIEYMARQVIGAAIEVHRRLGPGYAESVYHTSLCIELDERRIPFAREWGFKVSYKERVVGTGRIDILVDNCLVVELKSVEALIPVFTMQTLSYLRATGLPLGLLINFNVDLLRSGIRRVINLPQ